MNLPFSLFAEAGAGTSSGGGAGTGTAGAGTGTGTGAGADAGAGTGTGTSAGTGTQTAPKAFYDGLYGADGKLDKTAFDRLPEYLKPHKDLFAKYDTVEALLGGFSNSHSLAVKKAMAPLSGNEPPEVVAEHNALIDQLQGVPKDPKGYGIARPADLPEQFWNQAAADEFATLARQFHVSPAGVKAIMGLQERITKQELARGQQIEQEHWAKQDQLFEAAVQKLGISMDDAMALAKRGAATLGFDLKGNGFKSAEARLAAIRMTNLVSEDKLIKGDPTGETQGNELEQARDIMSNPQNPLHAAWMPGSTDPRHEQAVSKVAELYRIWGEKNRGRSAQPA